MVRQIKHFTQTEKLALDVYRRIPITSAVEGDTRSINRHLELCPQVDSPRIRIMAIQDFVSLLLNFERNIQVLFS
jgi:hypothetical protein